MRSADRGSARFLIAILLLQLVECVSIWLDVFPVRQVIGFIYFTLVPGMIILSLLRLENLEVAESVVLCVGLSVAFLMFMGLLTNEISLEFGVLRPLSSTTLGIALNLLLFTGTILIFLRDKNMYAVKNFKFSPSILIFVILPFLSVIGAMRANALDDNAILLSMIMAISFVLTAAVLSKRSLSEEFYAFAVFAIALSLLYHSSLISNYLPILASDATGEYFVFQNTYERARWVSTISNDLLLNRVNSMLSVTILPTAYSVLLGILDAWTFKIIHPILFSLVPVILYQIWQAYIGRKGAFASAFFFSSMATFYSELLGLNRQMIAELFLALLLFVVSKKKINMFSRTVLFIIFAAAMIVSHYSISIIFLFFILCIWTFSFLMQRMNKNVARRMVTVTLLILFLVMAFSWYLYTAESASLDSFVKYGEYVYDSIHQFFDLSSREETVLRGLGLEASPTVFSTASRAFAYLTEFLIVIGFIGLSLRKVRAGYDQQSFAFVLTAMVFLAATILVPSLSTTLNMTRFYHVLLFFLAPLCALGAKFVVQLISGNETEIRTLILLLAVLVPYFLFQSNFVYELTGSESWSISLSKYRMSSYKLYIWAGYFDDSDVFGARWVRQHTDPQSTGVYADLSSYVLVAYGGISWNNIRILTNETEISGNEIVFLSRFNTISGIITNKGLYNVTDLCFVPEASRIYSNGVNKIYQNALDASSFLEIKFIHY